MKIQEITSAIVTYCSNYSKATASDPEGYLVQTNHQAGTIEFIWHERIPLDTKIAVFVSVPSS